VLLVAGAELSVRGAVRLAALLRVRPLIIGLTVVAFGSSAPQMAVSLQSAFSYNTDIGVGSVIGGNIFNVLVTLGLSALIIPLRVARELVRIDIPLMIGASLLVCLLAWDHQLGPFEGVILLIGLVAYLLIVLRQSGYGARHGKVISDPRPRQTGLLLIRLAAMAVGLALLISGSHLLVNSTVVLAADLGLSERIIGLTVIAVSTSLPALVTSLIAAMRGERHIAVGNVVGSNLFNLCGVLGLTALLAPQPLSVSPNALTFDLPIMLGVAVLCLPLMLSAYRITRAEGLLLLALYAAYGLHLVALSTGMALAERLEQVVIWYVLPVLAVFIVYTALKAWRH
jgi:cation:H+ antiporter